MSEHAVRIRRAFRRDLQHVPVLYNLSRVIQPENVDANPITIAGPFLQAMQRHVIALGDDAFEMNALAWITPGLSSKYSMKPSLPSFTPGLCWMYTGPAYRAMASRGRDLLKAMS